MNTKQMLIIAAIALGTCGLCTASTITLAFSPGTENGAAGSAVTFSVVLQNQTSDEVFLNEINVNLPDFPPSAVDLSLFFSGPASIPGSGSVGPFALFHVTIPAGFAAGTYSGTVDLLGGPSSGDLNLLFDSPASFTVGVTGGTAAVPEPGTLWTTFVVVLMMVGFRKWLHGI